MILIATSFWSFELSKLYDIYPKLFGYNIKSVYKGKFKPLILYFYNLFKLHDRWKNKRDVVVSKIYSIPNEYKQGIINSLIIQQRQKLEEQLKSMGFQIENIHKVFQIYQVKCNNK